MKKLFSLLLIFIVYTTTQAQILEPVKWSFSSKKVSDNEADLLITAKIDAGWHVYSQFIDEGGPIPTSFTFTPSSGYSLSGKVSEAPKATSAFDKNFGMQISWHEKQVVFKQRIKLKNPKTTIAGVLEFMVCNNERCLPPAEVEFKIPINLASPTPAVGLTSKVASDTTAADTAKALPAPAIHADSNALNKPSPAVVSNTAPASRPATSSLWGIFIAGFLGGLAAFFMPCIYPMIPLTVSYFTKKAGSRFYPLGCIGDF